MSKGDAVFKITSAPFIPSPFILGALRPAKSDAGSYQNVTVENSSIPSQAFHTSNVRGETYSGYAIVRDDIRGSRLQQFERDGQPVLPEFLEREMFVSGPDIRNVEGPLKQFNEERSSAATSGTVRWFGDFMSSGEDTLGASIGIAPIEKLYTEQTMLQSTATAQPQQPEIGQLEAVLERLQADGHIERYRLDQTVRNPVQLEASVFVPDLRSIEDPEERVNRRGAIRSSIRSAIKFYVDLSIEDSLEQFNADFA